MNSPDRARAAASSLDSSLALLGGLSPRQFMTRHWQRRPLCIRAAIAPDAKGIVTLDRTGARLDLALLRRLAADDEVESRLVYGPRHVAGGPGSQGNGWRLAQGPFQRLPAVSRPGWSLLVQGMDLHVDSARALLNRFRFVSDARLDDLMVSFASDGGGVGAHVDSYDVFLLQLEGRRHWSIAPPVRSSPARQRSSGRQARAVDRLREGEPDDRSDRPGTGATSALRHLDAFEPTQQWLLEPGDMLYLPPGWGHDGVALGPCLTASIGFRSPTPAQWLSAIHATLEDEEVPALALPFRDGGARASDQPGQIPDSLADHFLDWQRRWRPSPDQLERALGRLLTEPKPQVWFDPDETWAGRSLSDGRHGLNRLVVDRRSRLLYRGRYGFINGEVVEPPATARRWLQHFADHRDLAASDLDKALRNPWLAATLADWLAAGWIHGSA